MTKRAMADGTKRVAKNGYHYTKVDGVWRLDHHIVAEEKLGRPLNGNERVYFLDRDRENLDPDNIEVREIVKSKEARIEWLRNQIEVYQSELDSLVKEGK